MCALLSILTVGMCTVVGAYVYYDSHPCASRRSAFLDRKKASEAIQIYALLPKEQCLQPDIAIQTLGNDKGDGACSASSETATVKSDLVLNSTPVTTPVKQIHHGTPEPSLLPKNIKCTTPVTIPAKQIYHSTPKQSSLMKERSKVRHNMRSAQTKRCWGMAPGIKESFVHEGDPNEPDQRQAIEARLLKKINQPEYLTCIKTATQADKWTKTGELHWNKKEKTWQQVYRCGLGRRTGCLAELRVRVTPTEAIFETPGVDMYREHNHRETIGTRLPFTIERTIRDKASTMTDQQLHEHLDTTWKSLTGGPPQKVVTCKGGQTGRQVGARAMLHVYMQVTTPGRSPAIDAHAWLIFMVLETRINMGDSMHCLMSVALIGLMLAIFYPIVRLQSCMITFWKRWSLMKIPTFVWSLLPQ